MVILDKRKVYTSKDIALIENSMLSGILHCRTQEAVEAAITYARFLSKTGLTYENYPLFVKILEIGPSELLFPVKRISISLSLS